MSKTNTLAGVWTYSSMYPHDNLFRVDNSPENENARHFAAGDYSLLKAKVLLPFWVRPIAGRILSFWSAGEGIETASSVAGPSLDCFDNGSAVSMIYEPEGSYKESGNGIVGVYGRETTHYHSAIDQSSIDAVERWLSTRFNVDD